MTGHDVNIDFNEYMGTFLELYNTYFPVKEYKIKEKHIGKPNITTVIRNSIKERNRLQKLYAKWPLTYERQFKKYRNMLTSLIRKAKNDYLINTLKEGAGNSKKTWNVVNDLLGRKRNSNSNVFVHQGRNLTDSLHIAEEFNNYFSNLAENLAQRIENFRISYERCLTEPVHFFLFT